MTIPSYQQALDDLNAGAALHTVRLGDVILGVVNAYLEEEVFTEDEAEDTKWGLTLCKKVAALEEKTAHILSLVTAVSKIQEDLEYVKQAVNTLSAKGPAQTEAISLLSAKVDAIEDAVEALS